MGRTGTADGNDTTSSRDGSAEAEKLRALSDEAVDVAVKQMVMGGRSGDRDRGGGDAGCVQEEVVRGEVDVAIGKLRADGTGLRDYANAAVGGRVVRPRRTLTRLFCFVLFFWHCCE